KHPARCFSAVGTLRNEALVYGIFKRLASLEAWRLAGRDRNRLPGLGITTLSSRSFAYGKHAEADQRYLVALLQSTRYRLQEGINSSRRISLGKIRLGGHLINEFGFVHKSESPADC